jgi:hypothetical protein
VGSPEYEQKRATIENLQKRVEAGEIDQYYEDEMYMALLSEVATIAARVIRCANRDTPPKQ